MGAVRGAVVVGVDGSASSRDAVRWAAAEAERRHTLLRVVVVVPAGARRDMPGLADALQPAHERPGLRVVTVSRPGDPVRVLLEESRRAALLVVGNRGLGALTGLVVGSVSGAVTSRAECPVVVARGPERTPRPDDPVILGVEGTPAGEAAIAFAFATADALDAPLVALHVWRDPFDDPEWSSPFVWEDSAEEERELLAERLAGWQERCPGVAVSRLVVTDRPVHALVERSVQARMLVLGGRRHRYDGPLVGAVTRRVLHEAQCPVAVVRAPATAAVAAGRSHGELRPV